MTIRMLFFVCLSTLAGCSAPSNRSANSNELQTFVDDLDRSVTVADPLQRIIPLAPNLTEIVYAAGAGKLVAAVSQADDHPPAVQSLPRFSSFPLDYEALVYHAPNVALATDQVNNPRDADEIESLGIPVVYFSFDGWDDVVRVIRRVGELAGTSEIAERAADSLHTVMTEVARSTEEAPYRPTVVFLIGSDQLFSFGAGSYIHEIIEIAGGVSLTAEIGSPAPVLSEEFVLTSQPDVIAGTFSDAASLVEHHPVFETIPAVKNDRICTIPPSLLLRPGPRLTGGATALAKCLRNALQPPESP